MWESRVLWLVVGSIATYLLVPWLTSYTQKKGENQAAFEDQPQLTRLEELEKNAVAFAYSRAQAASSFEEKIAEAFCELDSFISLLIDQYGRDAVDKKQFPRGDKEQLLSLEAKINTQLAKLYLVLPDEMYEGVKNAIPSGQHLSTDFRDKAFIALRKVNFPSSKFLDKDNVGRIGFLSTSDEAGAAPKSGSPHETDYKAR